MSRRIHTAEPSRRGAVLVLAAILLTVLLGLVAFGTDIGFIVLVRTQLQAAADSAAMAGAASMGLPRDEMVAVAQRYAAYHTAGGRPVNLLGADVEYGTWDATTRRFTPSGAMGNAIRVTARTEESTGGEAALFFGRIFGHDSFAQRASAVAMANPRDIAFVVDLSGSMNDDTEPCWATPEIDRIFGSEGYPHIGDELMQQVYDDFGFGPFPGPQEYIGQPTGIANSRYTYAELTKDNGPLSGGGVPAEYRIRPTDTEAARKVKAYSAIIDYQIARLMPNALPAPTLANYAYWEKYIDYVCRWATIRPPSGNPGGGGGGGGGGNPAPPKPPVGWLPTDETSEWFVAWQQTMPREPTLPLPTQDPARQLASLPGAWEGLFLPHVLFGSQGTPPINRGTVPPGQNRSRHISRFNNPNRSTYADARNANGFRNMLGYRTYVQFMMDYGRDLKVVGNEYAPISIHSPDCPWHAESTAGGTFEFPPREQPMHAARRAMIAAIQVVKERNATVPDHNQRDWVSIICFDTLANGGPVVGQPLTGDYDAAMRVCTQLQAVGDLGYTTATESGLIAAREHLAPPSEGGAGRRQTNKIVVLLTDGVPNLYSSDPAEIDRHMSQNPDPDYYANGAYWLDAALMQAMQMQTGRWQLFPVGVGLGTDYDFMDRMARLGGTSNDQGESSRGSGNPAEYERRLTEIFEEIITNPQVRLVQ